MSNRVSPVVAAVVSGQWSLVTVPTARNARKPARLRCQLFVLEAAGLINSHWKHYCTGCTYPSVPGAGRVKV